MADSTSTVTTRRVTRSSTTRQISSSTTAVATAEVQEATGSIPSRSRKRVKVERTETVAVEDDQLPTDTHRLLAGASSSKLEVESPSKPKPKRKGKAKAYSDGPIDTSSFLPRISSPWKAGAHVSAAGGVQNAVVNAAAIGASSFALFVKSQRKWESPALTETSISQFKQRMKELNYSSNHVLPHGSYLINLGNPDDDKRKKSYDCFLDDLKRCEALGLTLYNLHPGSSLGHPTSTAISLIAQCINEAHLETTNVVVVLENMAGAGNIIGATFEQLAEIIEQVKDKSRVGVCFDTCHGFSAGFDIRTSEGWNSTMEDFDRIIGLRYLKGMHLNDSKTPFNSKKDRHENLGMGFLKLAAFRHILTDPRTQDIPLVLETPSFEKPAEVWGVEIAALNRLSESVEQTPSSGSEDVKAESKQTSIVDMEALEKEISSAVRAASAGSKSTAKKVTKGKSGGKRKRKGDDVDEDDEDDDSGCDH